MIHLTRREASILRALLDPQLDCVEAISRSLGLSPGSVKVYLGRIYKRMGLYSGGSIRVLTLWAVVHAEELGLALPTADQFPAEPGGIA